MSISGITAPLHEGIQKRRRQHACDGSPRLLDLRGNQGRAFCFRPAQLPIHHAVHTTPANPRKLGSNTSVTSAV